MGLGEYACKEDIEGYNAQKYKSRLMNKNKFI
jgi:hypothetical protein